MNDSPFYEKFTDAAKTIFSYCMAKTSNKEDAEDLSQEIVLKAFRALLIKNDIGDGSHGLDDHEKRRLAGGL